MSYTDMPEGPIPTFCTICARSMRHRVIEMLPLDPQTGEGTRWWVVECPMHDGGRWGTKHHYNWWKSWYHDGFKVEQVEKGFKPPKTEKPKPPPDPMAGWIVLGFFGVMGLFMILDFVGAIK